MRMSGLLIFAVGAIVSLFSWFLATKGQKMTLFIFVGVAMAVYGLFKFFIDKSAPSEEEERSRRRAELLSQLPQGQRHNHDIPRICSVCRTKNNPRANFCGNCGNRL